MIKILKEGNNIYLDYEPYNGADWIGRAFDNNEEINIKEGFILNKIDKIFLDEVKVRFLIGIREGEYFIISKRILDIEFDLQIHTSVNINIKLFVTQNKISIFKKLEDLARQPIIIGGKSENAIQIDNFYEIIDALPTKTELAHYLDSRITNVMSQYLEGVKDKGKAFENYLNRKNKDIRQLNNLDSIKNFELNKYEYILEELNKMLLVSSSYSEKNWQDKILTIILLIYPKYIKCFKEVIIKDFYSSKKVKNRRLDLMLINANGNIDIIEIKRPEYDIISKGVYRDNHIPMRELSGTIMQIEKYVFHLNKWGQEGEKNLQKKYEIHLPPGMHVQITNPKGIVIMGRHNLLSKEQKFDFEIIKRKYSNILDIVTYDDLIERITNIISTLRQELQ